ncbi:acyl-CoA N-acyltransferase [Cylindrobasidium torrendii FP15055 ss-10]|uniref:Acyl-CoA N-acyltransferase n=1 Tax=Cylindrobasidium torrendii FP15055 ss-10 TaxID=1314674 RepID=A0A0D7AV25_9AGAR|nr:acyl-CoA N-acyltransferase [Cylindrobasidium torrendii FP15055 ss-10]
MATTGILSLDEKSEWTPDPTFRIDTPRLFLSHCSPDNPEDIDFFITLSCLLSATGEGTPREEMQTLMRQRNAQALRFGWPGWFRVTLKETGTLIGKCTLVRARPCPEELWWPAPDIGFTFLPEARGKGYATEAAKALIAWAQETHNVKEVLGFCAASNEKSQKALQRLGLVRWGQGEITMLNLEDPETMVFGPPGRTSLEGYVDQNKLRIIG